MESNHKKMFFFAKYAVVHEPPSYKLGTIGGDATLYSKNYGGDILSTTCKERVYMC